jgi:adenylate cyclase
VNTASRIESLTRKLEYPILVSEEVYDRGKEQFEFEYLGEFQVKGKSEMIKIYGLVKEK